MDYISLESPFYPHASQHHFCMESHSRDFIADISFNEDPLEGIDDGQHDVKPNSSVPGAPVEVVSVYSWYGRNVASLTTLLFSNR